MCNIAGYTGEKDAAPILINMLSKEEGIDAGFYTGIATVHEGRIYYRKVLGDLTDLLEQTDAASLPGKVGIIHSRTKSGGPAAWSHPFVSGGIENEEPTIAYVANGNSGIFKSRDPEYNRLAESLIEEGYKMESEIELEDGIYNRLSNGKMVHMSDVMCSLIAKEIDLGNEPDSAMANAFTTMPGDIVGLLLSLKAPDRVFWSKISRPMNLAYASHGAYLATTTIAFPDDVTSAPLKLPTLSTGYVTKNSFKAERYENPPAELLTADLATMTKIYSAVEEALKDGKARHIYEINEVVRRFLPYSNDKVSTYTQAAYEVLEALYREDQIEIVKETVDAVEENKKAPYYKFRLK